MKTRLREMIREEGGAALVLALVLLLIGGLLIAPLLGHMGTGIIAGGVHEQKMDELYAADAGVEDAIWTIRNVLPPESYPYEYPEPLHINDKSVSVSIDREPDGVGCGKVYRYKIISESVGPNGGTTTVEAYLEVEYRILDFSGLLDHAISSDGTIDIKSGGEVKGDIYIKTIEDEDGKYLTIEGEHDGNVKDSTEISITWPTAAQLSGYYFKDVEGLTPHTCGHTISPPVGNPGTSEENPHVIGPLLVDGDLSITGRGWIELGGTIYVRGDLFINPTPTLHLMLNGQTIFVEGDIKMNPGNEVDIYGSGCIIAVGEIHINPNIEGHEGDDPSDFVFIMSVTKQVWVNPNSNFYGAIAGEAHVQLQPNNFLQWTDWREVDLNFPVGDKADDSFLTLDGLSIQSWRISG